MTKLAVPLLILIATVSLFVEASVEEAIPLPVGATHHATSLHIGGTDVYIVVGLTSGASYEVVVSYTATNPGRFLLRMDFDERDSSKIGFSASHRQLLDTEKITFTANKLRSATDDDIDSGRLRVTLLALAGDPLYTVLPEHVVEYTVRVDRLVLGLPTRLWRLLACIVPAVAVMMGFGRKALSVWLMHDHSQQEVKSE